MDHSFCLLQLNMASNEAPIYYLQYYSVSDDDPCVTETLCPCSGYECNFVSEPDDALKCLICLAVARDPWQHGECGRLFCKKCLDEHGKDKPCPNCRMEQPQYLKDTKSKCCKSYIYLCSV